MSSSPRPEPAAPEHDALLARLQRLEDELRAARDDAARARQELQAVQRARDDLLSMLGHELRNPVGAIVSALDVLDTSRAGGAAAEEAQAIIRRQARSLVDLMNELLDARRVITGRVKLAAQPLDLAAAVARVQRTLLLHGAATDHCLHVQAAPAWIHADAARIEQVVTQLLAHALRSTPPGGRVQVEVAVRDGQACFTVQDTGPSTSTGGTGLGLTLVHRLVELHGGTLTADSDPAGSRFTVNLPAIAPPPQDCGQLPPSRRRRVLVVEDRADLLLALRSELELDGHAVTTALDGIEGLTRVLKEQPEVSIVDIGLPGLSGHEVARHARAAGYAGRMVAMSGHGRDSDATMARQSGFDAFLVKPVDRAQLRASLETE
ncbi:MAG: hybrid sensor histidine kinase/response regulator [Ramlibacter sp.]